MGRGIDSRNRVWNWVAKLSRLAGRYNNPMPTWFLSPIAGLELPTQESFPRIRFRTVNEPDGPVRYDNPIPTWLQVPIDCSKIPAQSSKSERSDLWFEAWKPVFVKRDMEDYMINLPREIFKKVIKLDFTTHGIIDYLSEFGLSKTTKILKYKKPPHSL